MHLTSDYAEQSRDMCSQQSCFVQEKGQLLENVFADPKGFGIAPDGRYRYELPGFSSGTAAVS